MLGPKKHSCVPENQPRRKPLISHFTPPFPGIQGQPKLAPQTAKDSRIDGHLEWCRLKCSMGETMAAKQGIFTKDAFQFFRDLKRHNHKDWMDAHRERYQASVVQPLKIGRAHV